MIYLVEKNLITFNNGKVKAGNALQKAGNIIKKYTIGLFSKEGRAIAANGIKTKANNALEKVGNLIKKAGNALRDLGNKISAKGNAIAKKSIVTNLQDLMGRLFSMAVTAGKAVAGMPIVGPILAAAAIGAAVAGGMMLYNKVKGDDVMSGPNQRTLFAGKDQISLNSDDTVVAGTDLFGKKKSNRSEGPDNSALIAAIDRLTSVVTTGGVVNIDGQKVAVIMSNLLALTSYKTQ